MLPGRIDAIVRAYVRPQFDPSADVPTVYPFVDAAGRDWCEVFRDETSWATRELPCARGAGAAG